LPKLTKYEGPKLVYVYSPTCPACVLRGPIFDRVAKGLSYSLNGREESDHFQEITGARIQYYPSLYGFSKQGRVILIDGNPTRPELKNIFLALEKT